MAEHNPAERLDVDAALAAAQQWLDSVDGVVSIGEGAAEGAATIDVWVTSSPGDAERFPATLHGVPVRVRDAGGPIEAG